MEFNLFEYLRGKGEEGFTQVKPLEIEKGILLYQPPQRDTPIYEIVKGAIRIGSYSLQGEEICYDILKPGDFFGNLQYLNGQFSEFAKTLTPVILRAYDQPYFKKITTQIPEVSEWFSYKLVSRWCRAEERLFAVRSLNAQEKVQRILKQFQEQIEDGTGKNHSLVNLLTLQDMADLTGMTRQTVSKVIKEELFRAGQKRSKIRT
ncbi:MAG: Crp/Fnr family transcriptional regulator [Algoriphagus aquaeductus]|uniref:Crp/Fnr family transcriptional regulator n=1 Tax=Algoriphagus aquaeductus TaxID=475299 RepID=UPI00391A1A35